MTLWQRLGLMLAIALVAAAFWVLEADRPAADIDARWASPASQWLALSSGGRLHFRDEGQADGLPVVLVHGSSASLHTFEPWVAMLGDQYRMITLDLPGHGLTGRVPDDHYSSVAYIAAVRELATHLGIDRFVLGGNSMGGGVSWRYALAHPEQVLALVLIDASPPYGWRREFEAGRSGASASASGPRAFSLLREPWFRMIARYLDPYYLIRQGLQSSYGDPSQVTGPLVERYYELALRDGTRAATLQRFGNTGPDTSEALAELRMPALVLWGARDAVIPLAMGERLARELPRASLQVYDDLGHLPMEEAPERTAADVSAFLQAEVVPGESRP